MKNKSTYFHSAVQYSGITILLLAMLLTAGSLHAQIPQNIEIEGEPAEIWRYVLYAAILVAVGVGAILIVRLMRRKK